ncbi:DUF1694 domain-containing protein [Alkaliphilus serpentinus]|uniref:YueI family protein n=1 Tax=Alkaliphilus serpentinus TaxID=1482731 RepID=A0A833HPL0_9FIRM|nr:DUF1694 domain-containing protein [Alkaliphilus serpentinus]KAB3530900.1 YueI family protein [Alkaliphilus serpentinus]
MSDDKLKRTIEFAIHGAPELKLQEKRIWLGEFRERVVMALTLEDTNKTLAIDKIQEGIRDPEAEMIIVNNRVPIEIMSKYMKLAKNFNKEYKTVDAISHKAMGVVIASRRAVNREDVVLEIPVIPEKFKNINHKELCPQCYNQLKEISSEYSKEFKRLNVIDRMVGIKCGACERDIDGGPLM